MKSNHLRLRFLSLGSLLAIYVLSGLYIVRGNEHAVVRRFGRRLTALRGPGLHYDLPYPFSRIDRVNGKEIRSISLGLSLSEEAALTSFDSSAAAFRQGEFLTGDKNVLLLSAQIQYRIADPPVYLYAAESSERILKLLAETAVTDIVSRCGVDYVHPLGLNELRTALTFRMTTLAKERNLGVEIEDVTLGDVRPPALVKQAFLDVSNARAERARLVSEAHTVAERLTVQSTAAARKLRDEAAIERQSRISIAQAESARFTDMLKQIPSVADSVLKLSRQDAMQRLYLQAMSDIIPRMKSRILVDGERPIDLSILESPAPEEQSQTPAR